MSDLIEMRRRQTEQRLEAFREALGQHLGDDGRDALGQHTCVYATGSAGRGEMGAESDLDLCIVRAEGEIHPLYVPLLQSAIIRATRACGLPEPDRDGRFLRPHTVDSLLARLGSPEDDAENTFTPRLLLLLESVAVVGEAPYERAVGRVLERYWALDQGRGPFLPIVLLNDVIRYWRILLLNHESRLAKKAPDPNVRRVKSFKLAFPRALTCFATIAYMLGTTLRTGGMSQDDALTMVKLTPLKRLRAAAAFAEREEVTTQVEALVDLYRWHLSVSEGGSEALYQRFTEPEMAAEMKAKKQEFTDGLFRLLLALGEGNPLFRFCLI